MFLFCFYDHVGEFLYGFFEYFLFVLYACVENFFMDFGNKILTNLSSAMYLM